MKALGSIIDLLVIAADLALIYCIVKELRR